MLTQTLRSMERDGLVTRTTAPMPLAEPVTMAASTVMEGSSEMADPPSQSRLRAVSTIAAVLTRATSSSGRE